MEKMPEGATFSIYTDGDISTKCNGFRKQELKMTLFFLKKNNKTGRPILA
jgi:hypothetical protein